MCNITWTFSRNSTVTCVRHTVFTVYQGWHHLTNPHQFKHRLYCLFIGKLSRVACKHRTTSFPTRTPSSVGPCGADSVKGVSTEWLRFLLSLESYFYKWVWLHLKQRNVLKLTKKLGLENQISSRNYLWMEEDTHVCTEVRIPLFGFSENHTIVLVVDIDAFGDVVNLLEGEHAPCI